MMMACLLFIVITAVTISIVTGLDSENIIGGNGAQLNQFPYQVYIKTDSKSCGGTIIGKRFILTAAQCVNNVKDHEPILVYAGIIDSNESILKLSKANHVKDIFMPSGFQTHYLTRKVGKIELIANDIAVLELENEFSVTGSHIGVAELPDGNEKYDKPAYVSGFGWDTIESIGDPEKKIEAIGRTNGKLKWAQVNIIKEYPRNILQGKSIPTSDNTHDRSPCVGDTGGPLVIDGKIVGILSTFHADCVASKDHIAYYTKVSGYLDFIQDAMKGKLKHTTKTKKIFGVTYKKL